VVRESWLVVLLKSRAKKVESEEGEEGKEERGKKKRSGSFLAFFFLCPKRKRVGLEVIFGMDEPRMTYNIGTNPALNLHCPALLYSIGSIPPSPSPAFSPSFTLPFLCSVCLFVV
jgi:hypothetical protein